MRCFIGIPLDKTASADLADFAAERNLTGLRLVPPRNLHLTIKFLGDVADRDLPRLMETVGSALSGIGSFQVNVTGAAYFPNARRARVFAATLDRPDRLRQIFDRLEGAMHRLGFRREGRAFHPHITLGRFRRPPRGLPAADTLTPPTMSFMVRRVLLVRSQLDPAGPTYTPLAEFPLSPES